MLCPKCLAKTTVTDSRSPGSNNLSNPWMKSMVKYGERVFGWWSDEFRIRRRRCCACRAQFPTIEVIARDLEDAFEEIMRDQELGAPWREDGDIQE